MTLTIGGDEDGQVVWATLPPTSAPASDSYTGTLSATVTNNGADGDPITEYVYGSLKVSAVVDPSLSGEADSTVTFLGTTLNAKASTASGCDSDTNSARGQQTTPVTSPGASNTFTGTTSGNMNLYSQ